LTAREANSLQTSTKTCLLTDTSRPRSTIHSTESHHVSRHQLASPRSTQPVHLCTGWNNCDNQGTNKHTMCGTLVSYPWSCSINWCLAKETEISAIIKASWLRKKCKPLHFYLHHVRKKNITNIFDCNYKKDYQISIIFDTNISDTTCDQMIVQLATAPTVCFCTTWENKINEILHFYPISPVLVFPRSAKADIWRGEN